jgi:hypothetical protein
VIVVAGRGPKDNGGHLVELGLPCVHSPKKCTKCMVTQRTILADFCFVSLRVVRTKYVLFSMWTAWPVPRVSEERSEDLDRILQFHSGCSFCNATMPQPPSLSLLPLRFFASPTPQPSQPISDIVGWTT